MAFAGGLLAGLAGLAEAPKAYAEGRRKSQEIETGDLNISGLKSDKLAMAALGSVVGQGEQIAGMGGGPSSLSLAVPGQIPPQQQGGGPQGAPGMPPGMSSQPQQPPGGMPPQAAPQQMGPSPSPGMVHPRTIGGQPQNLGGGTIPPGGTNAQPGGMAPQPRPPMPPGPPGGMPPGAPQPPGAGPPGGGGMPQQGGGPLNLNQLAQMIRQKNPNLPPEAMFKALQYGTHLLTPIANMELKNLALELRMQDMDRKYDQFLQGDKTKRDIASGDPQGAGNVALDAEARAIIKGDGSAQMPSPGTRSPMAQALRKRVYELAPDFNEAQNAGARAGTVAGARITGSAEPKADAGALSDMTKMQAAVNSFEETAIQNGRVLVDLAKKVDKTGIPVFERWIRAGRQSLAGDPDVTEFNFQYQTFTTEAAKILNNPKLTGILTNAARHEFQEALPQSSNAQQFAQTFGRIEKDFAIRKKSIEDEIGKIKGRIKGGGKGGQAPAAKPGDAGSSGDKPKTVIQNGYTYELQPDGSYK